MSLQGDHTNNHTRKANLPAAIRIAELVETITRHGAEAAARDALGK